MITGFEKIITNGNRIQHGQTAPRREPPEDPGRPEGEEGRGQTGEGDVRPAARVRVCCISGRWGE